MIFIFDKLLDLQKKKKKKKKKLKHRPSGFKISI